MSILRKSNKGNSIATETTGSFQKNPFELEFKSLKIGEAFTFRILSLHPEDTRQLQGNKAKIHVISDSYKGWLDIPIFRLIQKGGGADENGVNLEPTIIESIDDEAYKLLQDHEESYIVDNKFTSNFRIPVWVLDKLGVKSKDDESVEKLMFLDLTWSQFKKIIDLQNEQQGAFEFDPETGLPHYTLAVRVTRADNGNKNYKFEGLMGSPKTPDEGYGIPNWEFLDNVEAEIDESWDALQKAMDTFPSLDSYRNRLRKPGESNNSRGDEDGATEKATLSTRRGLRSRPEMDDDEDSSVMADDDIDTEEVSKEVEAVVEKPAFGRRRRGA